MLNKFKRWLSPAKLSEKETTNLVLEKTGNQIHTGPFAGLRIPEILHANIKLSEALGLYEYALQDVFSGLINLNISNVMVIGGHKGYYPAGLSNLLRPDNMYVFKADEAFFPYIKAWLKINELKEYELYKEATAEILQNWNKPVDFLLIDCEGAEDFLLRPDQFTWQKNTHILVEIHHFYNNKIMGNLVSRFKDTHDLQIIYDNILENDKIQNILDGLKINGTFRGHPNHRWIFDEHKNKIITSGVFLYMKLKGNI